VVVVSNKPLSDYLKNRANLIELIVVAVILGFSVNLLVSCIVALDGFSKQAGIYTSIVICSLCLLYLFYRMFINITKEKNLDGFILYNSSTQEIISVPEYDFSERISDYFKSAFYENPALKRQWETEPLTDTFKYDDTTHTYTYVKNNSHKLICEATEYYVLSKFCTYLTDYFNKLDKNDNNSIKEYKRNEIPDILLSNRFLELFSKPINERPAFEDLVPINANIVHGYFNGARYDRFDLKLPNKSTIKRIKEQCIEIDTPRFKLQIEIIFHNTNTVLPSGFKEYCLGKKRIASPLKVRVCLKIKFKLFSLLSIKGWQYYEWVDLLLSKLEDDISQDKFFKNINWTTVYTLLRSIKNKELENV
jgi:hypothetical protein